MSGAAKSGSSYARQSLGYGLGSLIGSSLPQDDYGSQQQGRAFNTYSSGSGNARETGLPQAFTHLTGFSHSLVGGQRSPGFFYSSQPLRAPPPVLVHGAVSGPAAHVRDLSPAGGRAVSPVRTSCYPVGSLVGPARGFVRSPCPTAQTLRLRSTSPFPRNQVFEAQVPQWGPTGRPGAPKPIPIQEPAGARLRFASPRPARIPSRGTTDFSPSAATRPAQLAPRARPELSPRMDSRPLQGTSPRPSPAQSPQTAGAGASRPVQPRGGWMNDGGWQSVQRTAVAGRSEGLLREDDRRRSSTEDVSAASRPLLRAETAPFKPLGFSFSAPSNDPGSPASLSPLASIAGDPPCSARVIELVDPVPVRQFDEGGDLSPASSCPRRRSGTWRDRSLLEPPRTCGVREWLARKASRSVSPATSDKAGAIRRFSDCSLSRGGGGSVVLEAVAREVCPSASPYATPLSTGVRGRFEPSDAGLRGRVGNTLEVPGLQAAVLGAFVTGDGGEEMIWTGRKVDSADVARSGTSSTVDPYRPGDGPGSSTTGASLSAFRGRGEERGYETLRAGFRCVDPNARQRLFGSTEPRPASGYGGSGPRLGLDLPAALSGSIGSEVIRTPVPVRITPSTKDFEAQPKRAEGGPYFEWTPTELKDELGRRGLSSFFCFDRSDLVDRLLQHDKDMRGRPQGQL